RVEELRVPINCLDVLAQQVVALAAVDDWPAADLYGLVRRAYPYRDLSPQAFETTLEMVSGRYRFQELATEVTEDTEKAGKEEQEDSGAVRARPPAASSASPSVPSVPSVAKSPRPTPEALQPRVSWDRVHNVLRALPGSQSLALTGGGIIPDTGQYA